MKKIAGLIKLIFLIGCIGCMVLYSSAVVRPKYEELPNDLTSKIKGFYALEEDTLDVLFMGTSHTYYGFNPSILYKETGLSSYVFAGECQPISVTYHYLVEALKTQSPSLIVLDVFALLPASYKCQNNGIIKKNLESFNFSENKYAALSLIKDENIFENLLDISIYKDRWTDLTERDFRFPLEDHFNTSFGFSSGYPLDDPIYERDLYSTDEIQELDNQAMEYLIKIFELAQSNGIDIYVVKTPYHQTEEERKMINYIFQIAKEYGFSNFDYNQILDELDYIYERDGDCWHCNIRGSWKLTHYLSETIKRFFDIQPKSDVYAEEYKAMYCLTMQEWLWTQNNPVYYLEFLKEIDITLMINYVGKETTILTEEQWKLFEDLGITRFDPRKNYAAVIVHGKPVFEAVGKTEGYQEEVQVGDLVVQINSPDGQDVFFSYDGKKEAYPHIGLNMIIADNRSREFLDRLCFDTQNEFQILKY